MTKRSSLRAQEASSCSCFGSRPLWSRWLHFAASRRLYRSLIAVSVLCLISLGAPPSAHARDKEFGLLMHLVESH